MSALAAPAARPSAMPVPQLRRVRWAVRATLTLGVAASVAANILHARPNPISQVIAAWPPLALLLTVELISRIPVYRRSLGVVRLAATAAIAGIAAWVSYWHMAGVAARYGETGASPYLLPLSVDGLVIVASVSLVEIAGRIRAATAHDNTPPRTAASAPGKPAKTMVVGAAPTTQTDTDGRSVPPAGDQTDDDIDDSQAHEATRDEPDPTGAQRQPEGSDCDQTMAPSATRDRDARAHEPEPQDADSSAEGGSVPSDTAAAVAYWYRRDPNLHPAQIGAKIDRSERTVRRYWPPAPQRSAAAANGEAAGHLADNVRSR